MHPWCGDRRRRDFTFQGGTAALELIELLLQAGAAQALRDRVDKAGQLALDLRELAGLARPAQRRVPRQAGSTWR